MNMIILCLVSLPLCLSGVFFVQIYEHWEMRQCMKRK